jgi:hypothetical protein
VILEIVPDKLRTTYVRTEEREYVRVTADGTGPSGETGLPELPVGSVPIGLPPGASPRLRVLGAQWSSPRPGVIVPVPERYGIRPPFGPSRVVEREPIEGDRYRSRVVHPVTPFELSPVRGLRGLSTVHVIWYAATTDVFTRTHRVLERAVLEVVFETDKRDPGPRPRAARGPERIGRHWERTYRGTMVNESRAIAWARSGPGDGPAVGDAPWGGDTHWKIRVSETEIAEILYSTLAGAGFPSGVPVENVSLYQREFRLDLVDADTVSAPLLFERSEVPIDLRDRNGNGTFDAGDGIVFWGRSVRDQWMTSGWEHEDRHDAVNAYWVRIDPSGQALRMAAPRPGGSLSGNPADSLDSTPSRVFMEKDLQYYALPPDYGPGAGSFENEFYYRNHWRTAVDSEGAWSFDEPFATYGPVPDRPVKLVVRVAGGGKVDRDFTNRIELFVNDVQVGEDLFYNGDVAETPSQVLHEYPIPANLLGHGPDANTFRFVGVTYTGSFPTNPAYTTRFFFDWYEIKYDRTLTAHGDRLVLSTAYDSTGNVLVRVAGFTGEDLRLYDITDAESTRVLDVAESQVVVTGGIWDLRFDHDHDVPGEGGARTFVAVRDEAIPKVDASRVLPVGAPTILAGGHGARYVIVTHVDLMAKARELAAYRSGRYSTQVAAVSEVYDVFGNGRIHPDAIKAYAAYAYHRWTDPIVFLCLIGDASEDHRGVTQSSDPDLVPSHSLWANYRGAPEESDQYYAEVTRGGSGEFDDLPDLYVGRIAVNTPDELDWNLRRIVAYESHQPSADPQWHHRVIFMADDAISGECAHGDFYGWRPDELEYENKSEDYAELITEHPLRRYRALRVYLSQFSHPCPDSCYESHDRDCETEHGFDCGVWYDCRNPDNCDEQTCERTTLRPLVRTRLLEYVNDGALIWNFQGHANRATMTHEEVFRHDPSTNFRDVEALRNEGRPFIFLGFGCHLAEFDRADEGAGQSESRDCLSEKMMNHRPTGTEVPGGAVGCFASSGFEFDPSNFSLNRHVMLSFFYPEIAADPANLMIGASLPENFFGSAYGWTLGESTTRARLMYQREYPLEGQEGRQAAQRYILLGDPALEPDAGPPRMEVTVDGNQVEDVRDPYFVNGNDPEPRMYTVAATASDPWGITSVRIRDTARGEVPTSDFEINEDLTTGDGVVQALTMTYPIRLRTGETYDIVFESKDANGRTTEFVFRVASVFKFLDEPVAYPNPFRGRVQISYKLTDVAERVSAKIYTVTGRRIAKIDEGTQLSNVQNRLTWDGRDDHGNRVARGTYLVRIRARSVRETIESVVPVVLMR